MLLLDHKWKTGTKAMIFLTKAYLYTAMLGIINIQNR